MHGIFPLAFRTALRLRIWPCFLSPFALGPPAKLLYGGADLFLSFLLHGGGFFSEAPYLQSSARISSTPSHTTTPKRSRPLNLELRDPKRSKTLEPDPHNPKLCKTPEPHASTSPDTPPAPLLFFGGEAEMSAPRLMPTGSSLSDVSLVKHDGQKADGALIPSALWDKAFLEYMPKGFPKLALGWQSALD